MPPALEILRPHNMLAAALGVVAGYAAAGGREAVAIAPAALLTALATGAGNIINDYFDVPIDAINKPGRPLPSGRLSPRAALVLYGALTAAVTASALAWLPPRVAVVVFFWQIALAAYARVLKRMWMVGNAVVAVIASSAFLAGALVAGDAGAAGIPMLIAFGFVMCREIVKGGEDVEGDRAAGVRTLATRTGRETAASVASCAMLGVAALIPAPVIAGVYSWAYFAVMEVLVVPTLILGAVALSRRPERPVFAALRRALKLAMFAGIVAIALGA